MADILIYVLVGLIAGFLASRVVLGKGRGWFLDIVIGILGAILGNWLADLLHISIGYQVFGKIGKGNGDPSLVLFKEGASVNHRKLANEFVLFEDKLRNRAGRVSMGFLISWNGFADTIEKSMLRGSRGDLLIVPLIGQDLREAVRNHSFPELLEERHRQAILT